MPHQPVQMPSPLTPTASLPRGRVLVVCLALFLEGMSSSSINVQVAALDAEFHPTAVELQLIAAVFLVSYAGLLPLAGQLVDRCDRRRVFHLGVLLFGLGSLLCAVAPSATVLVLGRFGQGAGAALSAPAALALITDGLPEGPARNRAVTTYGAMGAVGFSTGLVLPGALVTALGWRSSFLVLLPIVALVLATTRGVPRGRPAGAEDPGGRMDLSGALLLTGGLAVALALVSGSATLPAQVLVGGVVIVAVVLGRLVRRGGVQGVPGSVFGRPRVLAAGLGLATVFAGVLSSMFVLSLALQVHHGYDAYEVGLLILPQPVAFSAAARLGSRAVDRYGPGRVLAAGILLIAVTLLGLATVDAGSLVHRTLVGMAAIGVGMALAFPAASIAAVDAAPESLRGTTAGLLTTAQNIGGALGLAVVTAFGLVPHGSSSTDADPGLLAAAAMMVVGGLAAAWLARRSESADGSADSRSSVSAVGQ